MVLWAFVLEQQISPKQLVPRTTLLERPQLAPALTAVALSHTRARVLSLLRIRTRAYARTSQRSASCCANVCDFRPSILRCYPACVLPKAAVIDVLLAAGWDIAATKEQLEMIFSKPPLIRTPWAGFQFGAQ